MRSNHWIRTIVSGLTLLTVSLSVGCDDNKKDDAFGSTVSGKIVNSSNVGVVGVAVSLNTATPKSDTTDASGNFSIADVEAGNFTLTASAPSYLTATTNVAVIDGDPSTTVGNVQILLTSEQTGSVSGTITSSAAPVANIEVKLLNTNTSSSNTVITNAAGQYTITPVLVGSFYKLVINAAGYVADSANVTVNANATTTVNRSLTQSAILQGTLTNNLTLNASTVYTLEGFFQVSPGATLTIPAGTVIQATPGTQAAIITVRASGTGTPGSQTILKPNGKLVCLGTSVNPVVFTTSQAPGTRTRGLWGGIVMNGIADINVPGKVGVGEGNTGSYGPGGFSSGVQTTIADTMSSGTLQYVRVEFGGIKITPDNEINGFTFNGVGSNTIVDHCQAHMVADDGFEWFGGKVNAKYLVSSGNDDDMFDTDFGYTGKLQFLFGIQDKALGNRAMEADNDATGTSNTPISKPTVWNFTFIGGNDVDDKNNDDNNEGMYWRRNTQYDANNGIVAYFNRYGLVLDGVADSNNAVAGTATAKNIIMWNNMKGGTLTKDVFQTAFKSTNYDTLNLRQVITSWNILVQNPNFTSVNTAGNANPMNGVMPNPVPTGVVTGATPTNDGFFDVSATYIGAFNTTNWLSGWTIWATN